VRFAGTLLRVAFATLFWLVARSAFAHIGSGLGGGFSADLAIPCLGRTTCWRWYRSVCGRRTRAAGHLGAANHISAHHRHRRSRRHHWRAASRHRTIIALSVIVLGGMAAWWQSPRGSIWYWPWSSSASLPLPTVTLTAQKCQLRPMYSPSASASASSLQPASRWLRDKERHSRPGGRA
jgi:hypothetical protein